MSTRLSDERVRDGLGGGLARAVADACQQWQARIIVAYRDRCQVADLAALGAQAEGTALKIDRENQTSDWLHPPDATVSVAGATLAAWCVVAAALVLLRRDIGARQVRA